MENKRQVHSYGNKKSTHRAGRFYTQDDQWFFRVRETEDQGPFSTKQLAEEQLKTYLQNYDYPKSFKGAFDFRKVKLKG